jgi:hypothetical protein
MVTLSEALAAERDKRRNLEADALARKEVARAVLSSLADKLNATPLSGWTFALEDQAIRLFHTVEGARREFGNWTMDDQLQLVCGQTTTEWITSESYERVIDEAVAVTAKLIVDAEMGAVPKSATEGAEIARLPRRF